MAAKMTYEAGMQELEELVSRLESGDMPVEESFKAFEKGMKLSEKLKKMLDDTDARVLELTENGQRPLDPEEDV